MSLGLFIDLSGRKFGRLTVLRRVPPKFKTQTKFVCLCDCGREKEVLGGSLTYGKTLSCGCLHKEIVKTCNSTHGQCSNGKDTVTYTTWCSVKDRTGNPKCRVWKHYGGKGVKMCERWQNSFNAFREDMGDRPGPGYSIERIDGNGDYSPENCRWATKMEQANNRSTNKRISFKGEVLTQAQWERKLGFSEGLIAARIHQGFSPERALTAPVKKRTKKIYAEAGT